MLEIGGTVLLAVASLAVAWCSYQSALWNGQQDFRLAESSLYYRRANERLLMVAQQQEIDAAITINFMEAVLENRRSRIDYYRKRARFDLAPIFNAWLLKDPIHNNKAPAHPLVMDEYKQLVKLSLAASDSATNQAVLLWKEAQVDNLTSDRYTLYTVIFSLVMLLGAIASKITLVRLAWGCMLFEATVFFVSLMLLLFSTPVAVIS